MFRWRQQLFCFDIRALFLCSGSPWTCTVLSTISLIEVHSRTVACGSSSWVNRVAITISSVSVLVVLFCSTQPCSMLYYRRSDRKQNGQRELSCRLCARRKTTSEQQKNGLLWMFSGRRPFVSIVPLHFFLDFSFQKDNKGIGEIFKHLANEFTSRYRLRIRQLEKMARE